ncbi:MAG: hypothetical protein LC775_00295 [Acidobacteria bacterium]|nr:hypothetical protein [Acidobacteriota bacterium]
MADRYGLDGELRDLLLVLESDPGADLDEVESLTQRLHAELKELDVESVVRGASTNVPKGAKSSGSFALGTLLITLSATGGVITVLLHTARDWLARQAAARRILVTIDGDTIVLEKASPQERNKLIDAYIRRHEVG